MSVSSIPEFPAIFDVPLVNLEIAPVSTGKYGILDPEEVGVQLKSNGEQLNAAYKTSRYFECARKMMGLMDSFSDLLFDSFVASDDLKSEALASFRFHEIAYSSVTDRKDQEETALKMIKDAKLTEEVAQESIRLAQACQALCNKTCEALKAVAQDDRMAEAEKEKVKNILLEFKAGCEAHGQFWTKLGELSKASDRIEEMESLKNNPERFVEVLKQSSLDALALAKISRMITLSFKGPLNSFNAMMRDL